MKNFMLVATAILSIVPTLAKANCQVEGNSKVFIVQPGPRGFEHSAYDQMGRLVYTVRISPAPGDEFFDKNNLMVTAAGQFNGDSAEINPFTKEVYEPQQGGLTLLLGGTQVVVKMTHLPIAKVTNCTTIDALLGGYAVAKTMK